jgi:hypothetical protein
MKVIDIYCSAVGDCEEYRLVESDVLWSGINLLNFRRNVLYLVQGMSLLLYEIYQTLCSLKHLYLKRDIKILRDIRFGYS